VIHLQRVQPVVCCCQLASRTAGVKLLAGLDENARTYGTTSTAFKLVLDFKLESFSSLNDCR
jgi:hypothetical protein